MEHYSTLASCPLFKMIDISRRRTLLSRMDITFHTCSDGEVILPSGNVSKEIFVVIKGKVILQSQNIILATKSEGESLGEELAVLRLRSSYAIISCGESIIASVPYADILEDSELRGNLLTLLSIGIKERDEHLVLLEQRTSKEKVLAYLHQQAEKHHQKTFMVMQSKKELAELLCIDLQSLYLALKQLESNKAIAIKGRQYTLL